MLKIQQILRNEFGENVLNDYFDMIDLKNKYILVKKDGLIGAYDSLTMKQILKCEWMKIKFEDEYIIAFKENQIGVFNSLGENILNSLNWDEVKLVNKGIIATRNGKKAFFGYDGKMILDCIWRKIESYPQVLLAYQENCRKSSCFDYSTLKRKNKIYVIIKIA